MGGDSEELDRRTCHSAHERVIAHVFCTVTADRCRPGSRGGLCVGTVTTRMRSRIAGSVVADPSMPRLPLTNARSTASALGLVRAFAHDECRTQTPRNGKVTGSTSSSATRNAQAARERYRAAPVAPRHSRGGKRRHTPKRERGYTREHGSATSGGRTIHSR